MAINNSDRSVNVRLPDKSRCLQLAAGLMATCLMAVGGPVRNGGFLAPPAWPHSCGASSEEEGFEGPSPSPWHASPGEALALPGQLVLQLVPGGAGTPPGTLQGFCPAALCTGVLLLIPFCRRTHKTEQLQYNTWTQLFSYMKRCLSVQNIGL